MSALRQGPPLAGATEQPKQQQQRAATPGPRSAGAGLLRALRTSSGSLAGLLRPGRSSAAAAAAPQPSVPAFEVRGSSLLAAPPGPPRPGSAVAMAPSESCSRAAAPGQHATTVSIMARAGGIPAGQQRSIGQPPSRPASAQARRPSSAALTGHGVEPAAPDGRGAAAGASGLQPRGTSSLAGPRRSFQQQQQQLGGGQGTHPQLHQNPLYTVSSIQGSESFPHTGLSSGATPTTSRLAGSGPATPVVAVAPGLSFSTAPPSSLQAPSSCAGTPHATLQAASNLTVATDSRPLSPGPFLSGYGSDAYSRPFSPPDFGDSQPPTPSPGAGGPAAAEGYEHGGNNPFGGGPPAFRALSPIKTMSSAFRETAQQYRSRPSSPFTAATTTSASPASAAAGGRIAVGSQEVLVASEAAASPLAAGAAAAAAAAEAATTLRVPIFNQDGRLVGYKQNSNFLRPGGASSVSSPAHTIHIAESSAAGSTGAGQTSSSCSPPAAGSQLLDRALATGSSAASAASSAAAPAQVALPAVCEEFAENAALPTRGFPDLDNMMRGYVLGPVLGKGGFCSVRKALHLLTGQTVAVKIIEKGRLKDPKDRDRVDRELRVMRNLSNHVCVVRLYEAVETLDYVYLAMEHCTKGSLLDYVREKKKLPEAEAALILQQLIHALQFCHRKDVVHRDVKLENILIDWRGNAKLIDFGLCGYYVTGKRLRCHCGSPSYAAPEIVARKDYLGPPVDVWSLGVVLFAMLAGYLPFHAKEKKQLSEKILAGVYKPPAWMSEEAADLIGRMLTLDPAQRINLEEAWCHPWVTRWGTWEAPGVGAGGLGRAHADGLTGAVLPEEPVLVQLEAAGLDATVVRRALRHREWCSLTAAYNLAFEGWLEDQARLGLDPGALGRAAPAAATSVWQWDFSSLVRASSAASAGHGSSNSGGAGPQVQAAGAATSAGGGSAAAGCGQDAGNVVPLRTSPVRPCTATACGSPTRFRQEALAATTPGLVVAGRTAGAAAPPAAVQGNKLLVRPDSAAAQAAGAGQHSSGAQGADQERFVIPSFRPRVSSPVGSLGGSGTLLPSDIDSPLSSPGKEPAALPSKQLQRGGATTEVLAEALAGALGWS